MKAVIKKLVFAAIMQYATFAVATSHGSSSVCPSSLPYQQMMNQFVKTRESTKGAGIEVYEFLFQRDLSAASNFAESNCKNNATLSKTSFFCQLSEFYTGYMKAKEFLDNAQSGDDPLLKTITTNYSWQKQIDLLALNWHLDYFAEISNHKQIINNILLVEFYSRAIELALLDLREFLSRKNAVTRSEFKKTKLLFLINYVRNGNPLLWFLDNVLSSECEEDQRLCKLEKAYAVEHFFKSEGMQSLWQEIEHLKNVIPNFSPRPWPEAEVINQIYSLNSLLDTIRELNPEEIVNVKKRGNLTSLNSDVSKYVSEVEKLTRLSSGIISSSFNPEGNNQVEIYRLLVMLNKFSKINKDYNNKKNNLLSVDEVNSELNVYSKKIADGKSGDLIFNKCHAAIKSGLEMAYSEDIVIDEANEITDMSIYLKFKENFKTTIAHLANFYKKTESEIKNAE